jgi:hypothetical protein
LEQASQRFAKRVGPEVARIFLLAVHGEERAAEARGGDAHWQVGDANWVIWEGRKCVDTETGNTVYVSNETLYKVVSVCRRLGDREAVVYRCLELLPGRGFVVQSADRVRLPLRWLPKRGQSRILPLRRPSPHSTQSLVTEHWLGVDLLGSAHYR